MALSCLACASRLLLAQFKPALAMNPDILARYAANRLRVVRQVRYSLHNENALDLGLFLNGIPVATAELKTDFTQSVEDAVDQYRFDREPTPKGQGSAEPLLSFPNGALVHFAVSNMRSHDDHAAGRAGDEFLPFNRGDHGAAGNPPNEPGGHRTAYLWEEVWARDSWLEILGRYMVAQKGREKSRSRKSSFRAIHQFDATRKLLAAVLAEGPGGKYLIQHSAGSGKTNSIAWTAHFLADLHDADHDKLFDTVLVVSDRNVLDSQLQEAIFDFERTAGVVATIKGERRQQERRTGRGAGRRQEDRGLHHPDLPLRAQGGAGTGRDTGQALRGDRRRGALLADRRGGGEVESRTVRGRIAGTGRRRRGQHRRHAGRTDDGARGRQAASPMWPSPPRPRPRRLELFGRRPNPDLPASADNLPAPFHVYSMRQAIEEGFILDVLKNYTPYKLAFKLAHEGKELDEKEVERSEALKGIMRWVRLHPYNISQKVQVVVEHFRENVAPLLDGKAKAMVVVGSRVEAVRWQLAIDKYIKEQGYKIGTLVAFSGEVNDPESGPDPFSETSKTLNPNLRGRGIREAFDTDEYQILLVANKFQTGFDQPLLCGMYVDKRLAGIQAVQTLSRLNRAHPGKDTTYVVDFVNDPEEILAAFKTYYDTAELADVTDPQSGVRPAHASWMPRASTMNSR